MMSELKVGEHVKVNLPGETPWAEILEITEDGFKGRIANKTFSEYSEFERAQFAKQHFGTTEPLPKKHDHKQDEELYFVRHVHVFDGDEYPEWRPK